MRERIEELEKELEKVCGTYENDCSKCPKQAECEEYCKLEGIYEIVNRQKARKNNMKNYKITDKATKAIIGVVAMTPDQARRAEKDFIVKEAQPKRSGFGASAVGWLPRL